MADYPLVRAQSTIALARASSVPPSSTLLSRTYSVPDLTSYIRYSDRYKPQWHSIRSYTPYRWHRDYDLGNSKWFDRLVRGKSEYDSYWYDRYYYFSPLYRTTLYPRTRYYYSDYLPNPYYWSSPYSSYWTRYKGYWHDYEVSPRYEFLRRTNRLSRLGYDYDYPSYYRRYSDSAFNRYLSSTYTPYRSYLLDSMSTSLARGLSMYRAGDINFSTLNNYWLTPNYWDRRFKDWRELYCSYSPSMNPTPTYFHRRAREYLTSWNNS